MVRRFDVNVCSAYFLGKSSPIFKTLMKAEIYYDSRGLNVKILSTNLQETYYTYVVSSKSECSRVLPKSYLFTSDNYSFIVEFVNEADAKIFHDAIRTAKDTNFSSVFCSRTDELSAKQYFTFNSFFSQQQNMLEDSVRTDTFQKAILRNAEDFKNKIVLDVGAGTGILSFLAVQAGAKQVYAVEASEMSKFAQELVVANKLEDKIQIIKGKIEEIVLPESVDVIISDPMGYMLFNERMLESLLHARKWLAPGGKIFPSRGDLHIVPFSDDTLYLEQHCKANFWSNPCFHGVDITSMRNQALKEYFRQPIVDTFDVNICMSKSIRHTVDFYKAAEADLHTINIPLKFKSLEHGTCHGLAFWFDVGFFGSRQNVWLSTSPSEPITHWCQVRCLVEKPLFVKRGDLIFGRVLLQAKKDQSYEVSIEFQVEGDDAVAKGSADLRNPYIRYPGDPIQEPPQIYTNSPSEMLWEIFESMKEEALDHL